jgi:hypothetical protein
VFEGLPGKGERDAPEAVGVFEEYHGVFLMALFGGVSLWGHTIRAIAVDIGHICVTFPARARVLRSFTAVSSAPFLPGHSPP